MLRILFLISLFLGGCASVSGPSSSADPRDSLERLNRFNFSANQQVDKIFKPIAQAYEKVIPNPVQQSVSNVLTNLNDVVSLVNSVLQLNPTESARAFTRVGINSTLGLLGVIDVAHYLGLDSKPNTLGDTFKFYGWKESSYFVPPFGGPTTVRDWLGGVLTNLVLVRQKDVVKKPVNVIQRANNVYKSTYKNVIEAIDSRARLLGFENIIYDSQDPYLRLRDLYFQINTPQEEINIDDLVQIKTSTSKS